MVRWLSAVALAAASLPALAAASPGNRQATESPPPVRKAPPDKTAAAGDRDQFDLDRESEVLLDGRPSRYQDIPPDAVIQRMEVTREGVIVRIHFRTR